MGQYIEGRSPSQGQLLPTRVDDVILPDNPIRFIALFVASLDMVALGFTRAKAAHTGRPSYDPRALLMLYIYVYLNRIRTSRMLERECRRNIELWWLLDKLCPDHNTISDFRMENRAALKKVFRLFVHTCRDLKLISGKQVCIDGTPIRAVNSQDCATNITLSKQKLEYARAQLALVDKYLADLDSADLSDQGRLDKPFALDISAEHLPDREVLRQRIAVHEENIRQMEASGETQRLFTDPDARMMRMKDDSSHPAYNIQTTTDVEHHLIADFRVTNTTDMGQLSATAEQAKESLGVDTIAVIADKGYESGADIEKCILNGIVPDVGFKYDREERVFNLEYQELDETNPEQIEALRESTKTEDIQACLHAGILPKCYEDTNISIELQRQSVESCFIRNEDGRVTCPMGKTLYKHSEKKHGLVYESKEACRTCPNRCTDGKGHKSVQFGPNTRYVPVIMYGSPKHPLQQIPTDIQQNTPYHAYGRIKRKPARVMIYVKRDVPKQKRRMQISEHPFGTLKWYDGYHYFLCKGKEKVEAETALMYLSYNMRRAMNILGVETLIAYFTEKVKMKDRDREPRDTHAKMQEIE